VEKQSFTAGARNHFKQSPTIAQQFRSVQTKHFCNNTIFIEQSFKSTALKRPALQGLLPQCTIGS